MLSPKTLKQKTKALNKALHRDFATLRFAKSRELGRYAPVTLATGT